MGSVFLLGLMLVSSVSVARAQEPARIQGPAASLLFLPGANAATASDRTEPEPTHWVRGMLIGGAVGGVGLGVFIYALCEGLNETEESCLGPGLAGFGLGALGGGIIGALIGGSFPKRDTLPAADSTASSPEP